MAPWRSASRRSGRVAGSDVMPTAHPADQPYQAEAIALDIVHEDEVGHRHQQAARPGGASRQWQLVRHLAQCPAASRHRNFRELPRAGIVHRLDKDTSGLLVVARTLDCPDRPGPPTPGARPSSATTRPWCWVASGRAAKWTRPSAVIRSSEPAWPWCRAAGGPDPLPGHRALCPATLVECELRHRPHPSDPRTHGAHRSSLVGDAGLWQGRQRRPASRRLFPPGPACLAARPHPPPQRRALSLGNPLPDDFQGLLALLRSTTPMNDPGSNPTGRLRPASRP
jgi:hypothetical protein